MSTQTPSPNKTTPSDRRDPLRWVIPAALLLLFLAICCIGQVAVVWLSPRDQASNLNLLSKDFADYAPWRFDLRLPPIAPEAAAAQAAERATEAAARGASPTPIIALPTEEVIVIPAPENAPTNTPASVLIASQPTVTPRPAISGPSATPVIVTPTPGITAIVVVVNTPTPTSTSGSGTLPTATSTSTSGGNTPPTSTSTQSPATAQPTMTFTPRPPAPTVTFTPRPPAPTATFTPEPPPATATFTPEPLPATATFTPVTPTPTQRQRPTNPPRTPTNTPTPVTPTNTPVTPTNTPTPVTPTNTPVTPTNTPTPTPTNTPTATPTPTPTATPTATNTATPTATPIPVNLTIEKSADRDQVPNGEPVTFTITVTNDGNQSVRIARVEDTLPEDGTWTFVDCDSSSTNVDCNGPPLGGGRVNWFSNTADQIILLGPGQSISFTVTGIYDLPSPGQVCNDDYNVIFEDSSTQPGPPKCIEIQ